jgi:two-component system, cell cycle sensor histidine kinase and response regulator CckA
MPPKAAKFAATYAQRLCRSLLDAVNDVILILDSRSLRILDANESALRIYGYSKEELIGKDLKALTSEADSMRLVRHGQVVERTDFTKSGQRIDFLVNTSTIDYWGRKAVLSINRDISDRKRIEYIIAGNEKKLRLLIHGISEIVALLDKEGLVRFVSPQVERVLGIPVAAVKGQSVFNFVHPDDRQRVSKEFEKTTQEPGEAIPSVLRLRSQRGQWVPFEVIANNQLQDPDVSGVIFTARDLRYRKETEQALRQSNAEFDRHVEQRTMDLAKANAALRIENQQRRYAESQLRQSLSLLHSTLESTADGILVVSNEGRVSGFNQKFLEMWRIPRMAIEGLRDEDLLATAAPQVEDTQAFLEGVLTLTKNPEAVAFHSARMKDGRILERYTQPQRIGDQIVGRVWSFRDITHSRRLEEELRQSQKMEAVGRLAGGVAHDFNNLLMLISGYANQLLEDPELPVRDRQYCEPLAEATRRATALTRQLLAFSRKQPVTPQHIDLNEAVSDMGSMLQRLVTDRIKLVINLFSGILPVHADPSQIELMIMNLVLNARDAMPEGGLLSITTRSETLTENSGVGPTQFVVLEVSDTGVGMSSEIKERIFEPFFTTKAVGKGTGLGLSTVYGIAEQANGHITVESEPNHGTTFRIYLPRSNEVPSRTAITVPPPAYGHETLLLAEDEEGIRNMTRVYLDSLGYKVLEAADGEEALRISREFKGAIDLLITDVVMPGVRGDDLVRIIRNERPDIAVVFISGYAEAGKLDKNAQIVEKPFTFPELGKNVQEALLRNHEANAAKSGDSRKRA